MQTQSNGNGRGVQGRPDVKKQQKFGEERVAEIFLENKLQIMGLLATEANAENAFLRAQALAVAAYRKAQSDSDVKIDELSMVTTCLWSLRQKLDIGTEVWPVPYAGKITPIVSPDGLITLIMRSGLVLAVNYSAVFEGDEFEHVLGTKNEIKHRKTGTRPRAKMQNGKVQKNDDLWNALKGSWCVIDLKSGGQIVVYFNKEDLEYFKSLSPFGSSASSPWAKYGDAMAEVRALKRAAKRGPKSTELSAILLSAEDTDGVEIPDEIMRAVGARMIRDITGDAGSSGSVAPNNSEAQPPNTQHSKRQPPQPGDPQKLFMPGSPPQPTIWQAPNEDLVAAEAKARANFEANRWNEQYFDKNAIQLATIRQEMRERNLEVQPHPFFDAHLSQGQPDQEHVPAQQHQNEPGTNG